MCTREKAKKILADVGPNVYAGAPTRPKPKSEDTSKDGAASVRYFTFTAR